MIKFIKPIMLCCALVSLGFHIQAQTLADQLGYPEGTKLLIIHADDLAMAHSQNVASFLSMQEGMVNSASIMPPCPWMAEVADWAKEHPNHDLGIHLTLTNEWKHFRWGPVSSINEVPGLVNKFGFLHADCQTVAENSTVEEVEKELRAQIEQAIKFGIQPTHLDTHMGCLVYFEKYFEIYLRLAREYKIPAMVSRFLAIEDAEEMVKKYTTEDDMIVDYIHTAEPDHFETGMASYYKNVLESLKPGVSVLLIHCAYDNMEFQGISVDHPLWGAAWRQHDTDFFNSEACKKIIDDESIQLITWRELYSKWQDVRK